MRRICLVPAAQPLGDRPPEQRLAAGDGAHDPQQLSLVRALDDVAPRPRPHRREHRVVVFEHREHDYSGGWVGLQDPARGLDTVCAGHLDVHQDHIRFELRCQRDRLLAPRCLAHQLNIGDR